jgi:predicted DNA binding CopG/RHH family protein
MKMDADEKELLESVERDEWKPAKGGKRERARYYRYAKATFRKDRRLNIRLSTNDLDAIQKRALCRGPALPDADLQFVAQVRSRTFERGVMRPAWLFELSGIAHALISRTLSSAVSP